MSPPMSRAIPRFSDTYRRLILAAGEQAPAVRRMLLCFALAAVAQGLAFACFFPLFSALLAEPTDVSAVAMWLLVMALAMAADLLLAWRGHAFEYGAAVADVTHDLRLRLGRHLRAMPMQSLAAWRTGDLAATLGGNIDEAVAPLGSLVQVIIRLMVVPATSILVTLAVDWRMALAMALIFPLAVPIHRWQRRASMAEHHAVAEAHARTNADIVEYTQGLAVLRSLGQAGPRTARLGAALAHLKTVQEEAMGAALLPTLLMAGLVELGLLVVLALGLAWVTQGSLSVAAFAALLVVILRFSEPLALFNELTQVFDLMESALLRMDAVVAAKPLPNLPPSPPPRHHEVRFEAVSFTYAGDSEPALKEVSAELAERTMTALVGPSGSGKSTLVRLLTRYADPQAGTVRIGGIDIRALSANDLNRCLSVVFQDVYLFDDTILENIRLGRPEASDAEVEAAARAANADAFIRRLPQGYRTPVGDIGGSLSGGERQRISIARAILKDAPIVVLDEPTAALDTESERAVQTAIDTLVRARTVIVIAHRLSTIVGADQILVFDNAHLVERGRHPDLLAANGRYASLWKAQQSAKSWHTAATDAPCPGKP
ncbi:ABC transporter ATP-binding protein [Roseospirillum parvum]|uniref:ATP-binding cassette, subfamily B n=1 Tax=Roseospirillum parvum TaxID=83401 RepID=A0A1G8C5G4_9PROT|nr:ABC transporter ATP-binding protein [Roseospirillum parvum]SDH40578.1 ATP-binding cassette, subfamily B [Roseospirillum parvum]